MPRKKAIVKFAAEEGCYGTVKVPVFNVPKEALPISEMPVAYWLLTSENYTLLLEASRLLCRDGGPLTVFVKPLKASLRSALQVLVDISDLQIVENASGRYAVPIILARAANNGIFYNAAEIPEFEENVLFLSGYSRRKSIIKGVHIF